MIESKFFKINPRYKDTHKDLLIRYAQFGGGAEVDKFVNSRSFSNTYEFYIYAFFIGLNRDVRSEVLPEDKSSTFWEIENWKPKTLVNYLLSCSIAKSDFDMVNIEYMNEFEITEEIKKIKNTIEAYANGGFSVIKSEIDKDPESASDPNFFIRLLMDSKSSDRLA